MAVKSFREMEVWNLSMSLAQDVYALVRLFPAEERYALGDQLRRAVVSIPSNIAEGFGRGSTRDFLHYVAIAKGSLYEVDTQLDLASRLGYAAIPNVLKEKVARTGMMLNALIASLKGRMNRTPEPRITNHEPRFSHD